MRKVWRSVWTDSALESPRRAGALTLQTGAEMGIKKFPRPNLIFVCVCERERERERKRECVCVCVYVCMCV